MNKEYLVHPDFGKIELVKATSHPITLSTHEHAEPVSIEELLRDAKRYRWLRVDVAESAAPRVWASDESAEPTHPLHEHNLDAAIDKAMEQK